MAQLADELHPDLGARVALSMSPSTPSESASTRTGGTPPDEGSNRAMCR
jgi:hypothetical protein